MYDLLADVAFAGALTRAQAEAVARGLPPDARHILWLGGGTGRLLPAVLARAPQARVTYVEPSAQMLARARRRLSAAEAARVDFVLGTDADMQVEAAADVVVSFFFLDLFAPAELAAVVRRLSAVAAPGATWLVADFVPPRRWWQRGLLAVLYPFFRLTTGLQTRRLPDWPAALRAAGWKPGAARGFVGGAVEAQMWRPA